CAGAPTGGGPEGPGGGRGGFGPPPPPPAATPPVDDPLLAEIADLKVSADDLTRRGAELARAGRLPEAAATCERALELDPQNAVACANLITICSRLRQTDRAAQYYRQALRIN